MFAAQNTHIWLAEWYHVEWHETGLCLSSATKSPPSRLRKEQNWFEKQESDPKHTSKSTTDCCSGAKIALQQRKTNRKHVLLKLDLQANKSEGVLGLSQDRKNPVKNSYIKLQAVFNSSSNWLIFDHMKTPPTSQQWRMNKITSLSFISAHLSCLICNFFKSCFHDSLGPM